MGIINKIAGMFLIMMGTTMYSGNRPDSFYTMRVDFIGTVSKPIPTITVMVQGQKMENHADTPEIIFFVQKDTFNRILNCLENYAEICEIMPAMLFKLTLLSENKEICWGLGEVSEKAWYNVLGVIDNRYDKLRSRIEDYWRRMGGTGQTPHP